MDPVMLALAQKYRPANPVPGEWEPTRVAEALDILAGSRIVEHHINSSGDTTYVRLECGLQLCWRMWASLGVSGVTWTFPAAFVNNQIIALGHDHSGGIDELRVLNLRSVRFDRILVYPMDSFASRKESEGPVTVLVVGRWK